MTPSLATDGYSVHADVVSGDLRDVLVAVFAQAIPDRAGCRTGLEHPVVQQLARSTAVRSLVEPVLGVAAFAFRATLFDKNPRANWLVAWHQDRVVPVRAEVEAAGYGPWSRKREGVFVQPPAPVLAELLAVRVDLDGSEPRNGGMRVLAGTHRHGVLERDRIDECARTQLPEPCVIAAGGALCMRPLLLHSSSRATVVGHRRIVHLEFAAAPLPDGVEFAACVR
jgi:hypothetical protein